MALFDNSAPTNPLANHHVFSRKAVLELYLFSDNTWVHFDLGATLKNQKHWPRKQHELKISVQSPTFTDDDVMGFKFIYGNV